MSALAGANSNSSDYSCPADLTALGAEELRELLVQARSEQRRVERSNSEIVRKSGAMSVEVTRLQMELDDVTAKSASMEQMGLTLQETYLAQVSSPINSSPPL